jgi:hypothetical protein
MKKFLGWRTTLVISLFLVVFAVSEQAEPVEPSASAGPFSWRDNPGDFHNVYGQITVDVGIEVGDVIGVFVNNDSVNDLCVGGYTIGTFDIISNTEAFYGLLTMNGNDTSTTEKDGADPGDIGHFKFWDQSAGQIYYAGVDDREYEGNKLAHELNLIASTNISADAGGNPQDVWPSPGIPIHARPNPVSGLGLDTTTVPVHIVNYVLDWTDGQAISNIQASIMASGADLAAGVLLWNSPAGGMYDIVVDVNNNGNFDEVVDYVDRDVSFGVQVLAVTLSSFTATPDAGTSEVTLKWITESEINNLGFDIYRSESLDGEYVKINSSLIKGAGTDASRHHYKFVDDTVEVGKTYYYYIMDIDYGGNTDKTSIIKVVIANQFGKRLGKPVSLYPLDTALLQNFPNPFNPETWIPFRLAKDADVTIRIFDIRGQEIRTIHLGQKTAGYYDTKGKAVLWDGRDSYGQEVSSGIYFYSLTAGKFHTTKKLTIIK